MTNKNAIATDWKNIGNDMRVAMGIKSPNVVSPIGSWRAFLMGVQTLNPFGIMSENKNKHR